MKIFNATITYIQNNIQHSNSLLFEGESASSVKKEVEKLFRNELPSLKIITIEISERR